jgi:uncharacterized protein (DUF302 family)
MKYYINKIVNKNFEESVIMVKKVLQEEGFGIVSEIDIGEKIKENLNVEFRKYKILGACNSTLAYQALQLENKIGIMLPCNVTVQELKDNIVEVTVIDPVVTMQAVENKDLITIAETVQSKLLNVIASLS